MTPLIISMDKLAPEEVCSILDRISLENPADIGNIIFKFNDLIALLGLSGLSELLKEYNIRIMLDPKWNDIPNTLTNYMKQVHVSGIASKVDLLTVHANAGSESLRAVMQAKKDLGLTMKILAITSLTSQDQEDTQRIYDETPKQSVLKLTQLALDSGVDGVVCSAQETAMLREVFGEKFHILNPGIRFAGGEMHDQKRVMTPGKAVESGASSLVMGRPILQAEDMGAAVRRFFDETENAEYEGNQGKYDFEKVLYTGTWKELLSYIGAFYFRPEGGKYCRLASGLISNAYINIGTTERNYLVVEKAASELASQIQAQNIQADVVMGAQMGSVRSSLYLAEKLGIEQSVYTEKSGDDNEQMKLKRHDIDLSGKKVVISEDIVTKGSTLRKMKSMIEDAGGEVVAIACVGNRHGSESFDGVPLVSCYVPEPFELYWDENTPEDQRGMNPKLPSGSEVSPKPKNEWGALVESMRK